MQAQYGNATVSRVVDIDPFALPLSFLFPDATLEALAPARAALACTHVDWANAAVLHAVQSHLIRFAGKTFASAHHRMSQTEIDYRTGWAAASTF